MEADPKCKYCGGKGEVYTDKAFDICFLKKECHCVGRARRRAERVERDRDRRNREFYGRCGYQSSRVQPGPEPEPAPEPEPSSPAMCSCSHMGVRCENEAKYVVSFSGHVLDVCPECREKMSG
jgi:hypothetical protein